MRSILDPHQEAALYMVRSAYSAGARRICVMIPTAGGKTVTAAAIIERALRKGKRSLVTVPAIQLVDQTVETLMTEGIHQVGVLQGKHSRTNPWMPVQVASVQTLARRAFPPVDLVIIDECHVRFACVSAWMARPENANVLCLGLTATPYTRCLGHDYRLLLNVTTVEALIASGRLADFRVFAPSHPDLGGVRTVADDYHRGQLSDAMQKPQLVADAVATWIEKAEGRPTLCFAVDRAHAKQLQQQFEAAGIAAGYVDMHTSMADRNVIRDKLRCGELKVVCNVACLTLGTDWPFVSCISLCRPTKSEALYVQIVGRGLRTAAGKTDLLLLDHSDSTLRLGFVTDIHHDELDDGKPRRPSKRVHKPLPKECRYCGALKRPQAPKCWSCGFEPKLISKQEFADGALVELKTAQIDLETRQRWYSMLLGIAHERGFKPGWAAHVYHRRFKVWPPGHADITLPANDEVRRYVRHLDIAYAKSTKAVA
jgi:superfamily II DNA or RNA helicase